MGASSEQLNEHFEKIIVPELRKLKMSEGKKHDQDKIRFDLIPVEAIEALAKVLKMGSEKYGDNNWREGIKYHRVYRAAQHHLQEFWGKYPDKDAESGLPHLYHALCNIAFLITYEDNKERYQTFDDRVDDRAGSYKEFYKRREEKIEDIVGFVQNDESGLFKGVEVGDDCLQIVFDTLMNASRNLLYTDNPAFGYPDLTNMTNKEACRYLKPGMRVRVLYSASKDERGWSNIWSTKMDDFIGDIQVIEKVDDSIGVCFQGSYPGSFPAFVLEIVDRGE